MRTLPISAALAIAAAVVAATPAAAVTTEVYTISGTGSGILGEGVFTDAHFTFTLTGSMPNYATFSGYWQEFNPLDTASVSITGTGSGTLSAPTFLYVSPSSAHFSLSGDDMPDLIDFDVPTINDIIQPFLVNATSSGYNLDGFNSIMTDAGALTFTSASNIVFEHAGVGDVPEPATWTLMIAGFGLVGASLRRRIAVPA